MIHSVQTRKATTKTFTSTTTIPSNCANPSVARMVGTVLVFQQICSSPCYWICSFEASMCVTNSLPLGRPLALTIAATNCVQTLKGRKSGAIVWHRRAKAMDVSPKVQCTLVVRLPRTTLMVYVRNAFVRCAFSTKQLRSGSAVEFHAFAPFEASERVTNGVPLGCSFSYRLTL
jgi:hypothetical protein